MSTSFTSVPTTRRKHRITQKSSTHITFDKPKPSTVYYHQPTHEYYVHNTIASNNNHQSAAKIQSNGDRSCCQSRKCLICALLFLAAYYLLFLYKASTGGDSVLLPLVFIDRDMPPPAITTDRSHSDSHHREQSVLPLNDNDEPELPDHRNSKNEQVKFKQSQRDRLHSVLEQRRHRRKRLRRRNDESYEKLEPFPAMFVSDNPYYLDENLVILGQLKDAELHLKSILNQLESVACLFNSTTFILFESNSEDNTVEYLEQFKVHQVNCTAMWFNPQHQALYGNLHTRDDLLNVYDPEANRNATYVDEIVHSVLSDFPSLSELDFQDVSTYLDEQLRMKPNKQLTEMEIEEILYSKLLPIKFAKYREKIANHTSYI